MRLILPHLETTEAADLLSALRGAAALPEDRLLAGIAYSMAHLDPDDQRLLAAVCLFQGAVSAGLLGIVFTNDAAPHRFRHVPGNRWEEVLHRAAHIGLLTAAGDGWYGIHPALPAYLAGQWRAEDPDEFAAAERFLVDAFLAVGAQLGEMTRSTDAAKAYWLIGALRRTMGHLLSYALDHGLWRPALAILQPLREYWDRRWMVEESRAWGDRVLRAVESEDGFPGPLDESADRLWLSVVSAEAQRLTRARLLDDAEAMCVRARDRILANSLDRASLATLCHRLGEIAEARARWDDAENWHRKSLALEEELDDQAGIAWSYRALGNVAKARGQWDEARDWYVKSRDLKDRLGDRRGVALACSALGTLAEIRKQWAKAQDWHREVLDISKELGDKDGSAQAAHQLGSVAQRLGQFDAAEAWYQMSLEDSEQMDDPLARAASYAELGRLALHRDRVDEAEQWVHQHRAIVESLDDRRRVAVSYQMLGGVALKRGHGDNAERWLGNAIAEFEAVGDQHNVAGSYHVLSEVWKQRGQRAEAERCLNEALAVEVRLGDQMAVATSYGELGRLAADFGDVDVALDWTLKSLVLVEPPSMIIVSHYVLAHVVARLGLAEVERRWIRANGVPLPTAIRTFVEGHAPKEDQ
jgi:tetratricopeptide (TPR) repeat protein